MDKEQAKEPTVVDYTFDEILRRLAQAEKERAVYRGQAIVVETENKKLKEQIEELKKKDSSKK